VNACGGGSCADIIIKRDKKKMRQGSYVTSLSLDVGSGDLGAHSYCVAGYP
jgi:hypothetical protein